MYFVDKIKKEFKNKNLSIFVDMDGVIADYDFNNKLDFKTKRPIITNIKLFEELSNLDNVKLYILSICKTNIQIKDKNDWLDKYSPFFKERIILSKEDNINLSSKEIKCNYLKEFKNNTKDTVLVIDDDNDILKYLNENIDNIYLFQDSSIID